MESHQLAPKNNQELQGSEFYEIVKLVQNARENALRKVNGELVQLYFNIGKLLFNKSKTAKYGDKYIENASNFLRINFPELKGFTKRTLYRMRQFYEYYQDDEIVSAMLTQLSWANHVKIMSSAKTKEEREFYIKKAVSEKWTYRELARQLDSAYFERWALSEYRAKPESMQKDIASKFLDTYVLEFLDLPINYKEADLQKNLIENMKNFILELGKDFVYYGSEVKVQVGDSDFFLDLLFYHRELQCLVAFELKRGEFKPEYIGKMDFYLEALDREYKKEHENPSIGVILCSTADKQVVEYAISRTISPTLVSKYELILPPKEILAKHLQELEEVFETKDKGTANE